MGRCVLRLSPTTLFGVSGPQSAVKRAATVSGAHPAPTLPAVTTVEGGMPSERQIRCVIGDDHETLRRGLVALFEAEDDLTVVGQAGDGNEALALTDRRRPDVTVIDVR